MVDFNSKADPISQPVFSAPEQAPVSKEDALTLKDKVEESLTEIHQAKDNDEYLTMQDKAEIEILEAKLKSTLALLDHFLATGEWIVPTGPGNQNGIDAQGNFIRDLKPGWNGDVMIRPEPPAQPIKGTEGADYAGTIYVNDDGNPEHEVKLAFQASATTTKIEAFNHGKDIIYVETYKDDQGNEKKRYWIGAEHVTRVRANIAIDAHNLDHGVNIDLSRTYRISDGKNGIAYGTVGGFVVVGSDYNDNIIGSQGGDFIAGLKGNDTLSGMGSTDDSPDIIYGDDWEGWAKARGQTDIPDGDDTIDGGFGKDVIDGGGGINVGYESDPTTGPNAEHKTRIQSDIAVNVKNPDPLAWLDSTSTNKTNGWQVLEDKPGQVTIAESNPPIANPILSLKMPDGYDMAFAEKMSDGSVKITMVKHEDGKPPETFAIVIQNALNNRNNSLNDPFKLYFKGNDADNIIDFHSVNFENNLAVIRGAGGNDMILEPQNVLTEDGITVNIMLNPHNRVKVRTGEEGVLLNNVVPGYDAAQDPKSATHDVHAEYNNTNNEIVISTKRDTTNKDQLSVHIDSTGYNKAYVMVDPANSVDLLVVLVTKVVSGSAPTTLVVRIKDYKNFQAKGLSNLGNMSWLQIKSGAELTTSTPTQPTPIPVVYLLTHSQTDTNGGGTHSGYYSGNIIDGGDGQDFAFHSEQDELVFGVESEVVGHYTPPPPPPAAPAKK